jgi:hypothetical protein
MEAGSDEISRFLSGTLRFTNEMFSSYGGLVEKASRKEPLHTIPICRISWGAKHGDTCYIILGL